ncbi:hypothetical protein GGX14DRAFT_610601 [Mycena pura]|uniref:BHLH domain-containing protein n=1 Tax=Mycena pura TaxID=153505 RepID=A0AAD6UKM6_9AGAR|nr:hypothetical protein GGX14DRAFT_610601 [Mycena pura]
MTLASRSFSEACTSPQPPPVATPRPLAMRSLSLLKDQAFSLGRGGSYYSDAELATDIRDDAASARRASHNAVERARRDKLNARTAQLAALLPNLAGPPGARAQRRPSRAAITKSAIAYVHEARAHRVRAAQLLRALGAENDALRREVDAWRRAAGAPDVGVGVGVSRAAAFEMLLCGVEVALLPVDAYSDDEFDARYGAGAGALESWCEYASYPSASSSPASSAYSPQTVYPLTPPHFPAAQLEHETGAIGATGKSAGAASDDTSGALHINLLGVAAAEDECQWAAPPFAAQLALQPRASW